LIVQLLSQIRFKHIHMWYCSLYNSVTKPIRSIFNSAFKQSTDMIKHSSAGNNVFEVSASIVNHFVMKGNSRV